MKRTCALLLAMMMMVTLVTSWIPFRTALAASTLVDESKFNLKVQVHSSHSATLTLSGLKLKDGYLRNPANVEQDMFSIGWGVTIHNADNTNYCEISTLMWCVTPGSNQEWVAPKDMHSELAVRGSVIDAPQQTVTKDSISWTITLPSSETFDFSTASRYRVHIADRTISEDFSKEYTAEQCGASTVVKPNYTVRESDRETLTYLCMAKLATVSIPKLMLYSDGKMVMDMLEDGNGLPNPMFNEKTWGARAYNSYSSVVSYDDLFRLCLQDWKIIEEDVNLSNGYGGTVFENVKNGKIVIAYRNSGDITKWDNFIDDWVTNDFVLYLTDEIGPQLDDALALYDKYAAMGKDITLVGQSLGGGLAIGVSTLRGVRSRTFNSVPMFSSVMYLYPEIIDETFEGIDKLDHLDHISEHDFLAGLWDTHAFQDEVNAVLALQFIIDTSTEIVGLLKQPIKTLISKVFDSWLSAELDEVVRTALGVSADSSLGVKYLDSTIEKNHIAYKDYIFTDVETLLNFAHCHDFLSVFSLTGTQFHMNQVIRRSSYGALDIAEVPPTEISASSFAPNTMPAVRPGTYAAPLEYERPKDAFVIMGASGSQTISTSTGSSTIGNGGRSELIYGGNGNDTISALGADDFLIGGKGNDQLSGGAMNDCYVYTKGSGVDTIYDIEGETHVYLMGFDSSDIITCDTNDKTINGKLYHVVRCNGTDILYICTERASMFPTSPAVLPETWLFLHKDKDVIEVKAKSTVSTTRYIFTCPLSIQVYNESGLQVATLPSGKEQMQITEYGHFYVFEEADGGYGKVLELFDGYTIKATGEDEGTFDLQVEEMGTEHPQTLGVQSVPIERGSVVTLSGDFEEGIQVHVDTDGNGLNDQSMQLTADLKGEPVMDPVPKTGDETPILLLLVTSIAMLGAAMLLIRNMRKESA